MPFDSAAAVKKDALARGQTSLSSFAKLARMASGLPSWRLPSEVIAKMKAFEAFKPYQMDWANEPSKLNDKTISGQRLCGVMREVGMFGPFARGGESPKMRGDGARAFGVLAAELANGMARLVLRGESQEEKETMWRLMGAHCAEGFFSAWVNVHRHVGTRERRSLFNLATRISEADLLGLDDRGREDAKRALRVGVVFAKEWFKWFGAGKDFPKEFRQGCALTLWQAALDCRPGELFPIGKTNELPRQICGQFEDWVQLAALGALKEWSAAGWSPVGFAACGPARLDLKKSAFDRIFDKQRANLISRFAHALEAQEEELALEKAVSKRAKESVKSPRI